jgi:hypothetical protein
VTTETHTQEQQTQTTPETDLSKLSFAEYEKVRLGQKPESKPESAPAEKSEGQKQPEDSEAWKP